MEAKFNLGQIVMTRGVYDKAVEDKEFAKFIMDSLERHTKGDWGDLCQEDIQENKRALRQGCRLLSRYQSGERIIWIITEADRTVTTALFPEEY